MAKHAPRALSVEAQKLFREVVVQNGLDLIDDGASMTLLANAARALDRLRAAEAIIQKEGQTVRDRFGQLKAHPMLVRIDCEGQAVRQCLAGIVNHSAAASYRRAQELLHGGSAGESDPWGRRAAGQEPV